MLFEADYAKNYASIMYQCLRRARKIFSVILAKVEVNGKF